MNTNLQQFNVGLGQAIYHHTPVVYQRTTDDDAAAHAHGSTPTSLRQSNVAGTRDSA